MPLLITVVAAAAVFAIAAVVIGREARRLDRMPPQPVFNFEDAVSWVCEHVPFAVAAELSPDDVRRILNWHLDFFRVKGVSSNGSTPHVEGPVVVSGAETTDFVLARSEAAGAAYTPEQVYAVLEAQMEYLGEIGAIGPVDEGDGK